MRRQARARKVAAAGIRGYYPCPMTPFELVEPRTLREAASLLASEDASACAMGGGTAIMLMMKLGMLRPTQLISLRAVEKRYGEIHDDGDGLCIGALATLSALERSSAVGRRAPVPGGPYAAVVSRQVLEHVPDPRDFLLGLRASLGVDGVGLIETPRLEQSCERTPRRYAPPTRSA